MLKVASPRPVKEVEGDHQRVALIMYYVLLALFLAYCAHVVGRALRGRRKPLTAHNTVRSNWSLPNMVICDNRTHAVKLALHSGWSSGYGPTDTNKNPFRSIVQVLDHSCPGFANCFWLDFKGLHPVVKATADQHGQMVMDIVYEPEFKSTEVNASLPDNHVAQAYMTDQTVDAWCNKNSTVSQVPSSAMGVPALSHGAFPMAISSLAMTTRNMLYVSMETNESLNVSKGVLRPRRKTRTFYSAVNTALPVTNSFAMLTFFKWFAPCRRSELMARHPCGSDAEMQARLEHLIASPANRTQALLLSIAQLDNVDHFSTVDPFDPLTLLSAMGGFWAYVSGAFSLMFVLNEAGKRRPNWVLRPEWWTNMFLRFKSGVVWLCCCTWWCTSRRQAGRPPSCAGPRRQTRRERAQGRRSRSVTLEERVELLEHTVKRVIEAPLVWDEKMVDEEQALLASSFSMSGIQNGDSNEQPRRRPSWDEEKGEAVA